MADHSHHITIRKREAPQLGKSAFAVSPGKQHVRKSEQVMFLPQETNAVVFIPNNHTVLKMEDPSMITEESAGIQT